MTRRRDEQGVSTVLGAILMFGLLIVTLVTIQVKFVPVWDHQREADHMLEVQAQVAQVKSDLDRQADNRTAVPVTDPVTLTPPSGFRFFSSPSQPGSLSFAPAVVAGGFTVSSPQIHLLSVGGQQVFAGTETWQTVTPGTVTNMLGVQHFRLRVANPATYLTGDSVTFTVTDANGAFAGKFYLHDIDHGPTFTYEYQTFASTSQATPVTILQENFDKQNPPVYFYIDLMRSELQFGDVLRQATTPFQLSMERNHMQADYSLSYTVADPGGGSTQVGGGGKLVANYAQNLNGGALSFSGKNQRYPSQTFVVEHGAVIVVQTDPANAGAAMLEGPEFRVQIVGGQVNLDWVVPALVGGAANVAGPDQAVVTMRPIGSRIDLQATAPRLSFTLTTLYPGVWAQFWNTQMSRAGLTSSGGQPQFTTTTTATSATLDLYGLQSDPSSVTDDLLFSFKGATIETVPSGSGG